MALQGTLETFAVGDVLRLLASTNKTGRLRVSSNRGTGSVWIDEGRLRAAAATSAPVGAPISDVLFQLLRHRNGSFAFEPDVDFAEDTEPGATVSDPAADVVDETAQAEELLSEWRTIEEVVPSLDAFVTLSAELPEEPFAITASQWRTVREIGRGCSIAELGLALVEDEIAVSRTVKALVDARLVDVTVNVVERAMDTRSAVAASGWDTPAPTAGSLGPDDPEPKWFASSTPGSATPLPTPPVAYPPPALNDLPAGFAANTRDASDPWNSSGNGHRSAGGHDSTASDELAWSHDETGNGDSTAEHPELEAGDAEADVDADAVADHTDDPGHDAAPGFDGGQLSEQHVGGDDNASSQTTATPPASDSDASVDLGIAIPGVPSITSFVGRVRDLVRGESHAAPAPAATPSSAAAQSSAATPAATPVDDDTTQLPVTDASPAASEAESFDLGTLTPSAARAIALAAQASSEEERDAALAQAVGPDDQPMDRRVLLRFLSSVKQ